MATDKKTTDKKMRRYKIAIWVWIILTLASYANSIWDLAILIKGLWE